MWDSKKAGRNRNGGELYLGSLDDHLHARLLIVVVTCIVQASHLGLPAEVSLHRCR